METLKLYDADPYLLRADCHILSCTKRPEHWAVVTDRTIFFARGGGQPCDTGTLAGVPVLDVYEENGVLLHLVPRELTPGPAVMEIDWDTRRDHMQQHLGQHILSAAIQELFGDPSVIARIESPACHVELERPLTPAQLVEAQDRANEIIRQDLPVRCYFVTPEESRTLPVRGHISPHERVRLVEIEGFDLNGCGGTHCRSTAEVGRILFLGTKEVRGVFRVYYVCGERATRAAHDRLAPLLALQQAFGTESLAELCDKACAVLERKNALEEQQRALRARLVESDAERFLALAERGVFCRAFPDEDAKHLKAVCDRATAEGSVTLLLAAETGEQIGLVFARSKGVGPDLGALLRTLTADCGGRGGGSPVLAQGMVPTSSGWRTALDALAARLRAEQPE